MSINILKIREIHLQKRTKYSDSNGAIPRVRSGRETLNEILSLCNRIGVTRISNITYLDKLLIPNYSAVLPGTEDSIWVYNGKGTTESDAKASALMEAVERYSSLAANYQGLLIRGRYLQLSKSYPAILHPDEVVEPVNQRYDDKKDEMDFLQGVDLLTNESILVPAQIALYKYAPTRPAVSAFSYSHTNGLASGNVLEEAICHALCEVIERDAASIADLCASCIPYTILERIGDLLERGPNCNYPITRVPAEENFIDDSSIFPDVDISDIADEYDSIKNLINRFINADITLLIKDITQRDIGIATFVASSIEWVSNDYGFFAKGYGTHPDSRIALIRAITELSQTRAANVQGARDDLKRIVYKENDEIYKRKWQFMPNSSTFHLENTKSCIKFSEVRSCTNSDILEDIELILKRLKRSNLRRAIVVDLTNSDIRVPVVRAIVPGLETFDVVKSIMGERARKYFKSLVSY